MNTTVQQVGKAQPRITRTDGFEHWFAKRFSFGGKGRVRFYRRMERFTERSFAHVKALQIMWTRYHREGDGKPSAKRHRAIRGRNSIEPSCRIMNAGTSGRTMSDARLSMSGSPARDTSAPQAVEEG